MLATLLIAFLNYLFPFFQNPSECSPTNGTDYLPVPLTESAARTKFRNKDVIAQAEKWYSKFFVPEFDRVVPEGTSWKADARKWLEDARPLYCLGFRSTLIFKWDAQESERLFVEGKRLMDGGCNDPLIGLVYGRLFLWIKPDKNPARFILAKAWQDMQRSDYAAWVKFNCATTTYVATQGEEWFDKNLTTSIYKEMPHLVTETAKSGAYQGYLQLFMAQFLDPVDLYSKPNGALIYQAIRESSLDEWVRLTFEGEYHIHQAWEARGSGWASTVTEEGWKGFKAHLELAQKALVRAWELYPNTPEAATRMITVTMGGGGVEGVPERAWFDRAVAAEFDYFKAYACYKTAILPRWGGSLDEMVAFAKECASTKAYTTFVPYQLLKILDEIASEGPAARQLFRGPGMPEAIRDTLAGYLNEKSFSQDGEKLWTKALVYTYLSGDYTETARALTQQPVPDQATLFNSCQIYRIPRINPIMYGRFPSPKDAELFDEVVNEAQQGNYSAALTQLNQLLKNGSLNPDLKTWMEGRASAMRTLQTLSSGKWTPLPLDLSLSSWDISLGTWKADSQQIILEPQPNLMVMAFAFRPTKPYEFKFKYSVQGTEDPHFSFGTAGNILMEHRAFSHVGCFFEHYKADALNVLFNCRFKTKIAPKEMSIPSTGTVLLQMKNNAMRVCLNDQEVLPWTTEDEFGDPPSVTVLDFKTGTFGFVSEGVIKGTPVILSEPALRLLSKD